MRADGTDLPVVDRRGFFRVAASSVGLASLVAGGAALGMDRQIAMRIGAGGAGVFAAIAAGTALSEEAARQAAEANAAQSVDATGGTMPPSEPLIPATPGPLRSVRPLARTSDISALPGDQLQDAAEVLNNGRAVVILCGPDAAHARDEVARLADRLGAPVVKALPGEPLDGLPFTAFGIGDLGAAPSSWAMKACDTLIILGSTSRWVHYYPKPGQARGVRIAREPANLGTCHRIEVGLAGEVGTTVQRLLPLLSRQSDRGFMLEARHRMAEWNRLLGQADSASRARLRRRANVTAMSDLVDADSVISFDRSANAWFAARRARGWRET
jgi:thiamine pyrophosphate-dependent acetolactate synthase large subunit-like protein